MTCYVFGGGCGYIYTYMCVLVKVRVGGRVHIYVHIIHVCVGCMCVGVCMVGYMCCGLHYTLLKHTHTHTYHPSIHPSLKNHLCPQIQRPNLENQLDGAILVVGVRLRPPQKQPARGLRGQGQLRNAPLYCVLCVVFCVVSLSWVCYILCSARHAPKNTKIYNPSLPPKNTHSFPPFYPHTMPRSAGA